MTDDRATARRRKPTDRKWCPYPSCGFTGTDDEVDDHRAVSHRDEAQQGSNLGHRPR